MSNIINFPAKSKDSLIITVHAGSIVEGEGYTAMVAIAGYKTREEADAVAQSISKVLVKAATSENEISHDPEELKETIPMNENDSDFLKSIVAACSSGTGFEE